MSASRCPVRSILEKILPALGLVLTLPVGPGLGAAERMDLERTTPVPATEPIPLSDFFRPSLMYQPQLNPSGTHIAALVGGNDDKFRLLVYELKTQKIEVLGGTGDMDIDRVYWLNDQRVLFGISLVKRGEVGLYAANVGSLNAFYPMLQYVGTTLIAVPPADRVKPLVFLHSRSMNAGHAAEAVNVDTNITSGKIANLFSAMQQSGDEPEIEAENQKHIATRYPVLKGDLDAGFLADKAGHLTFGFMGTEEGLYQLYRLAGDHWDRPPIDLDMVDVVGSGNKPDELAVVGPRNTGQPRPLQFMDGSTGKLGEVLLQDKAYDFNGWLYRDPASREIVGAIYERGGPQSVWFNADYRKLQELLNGFFPGVVVRIIGNDEKGQMVLVATYSDRQPVSYQWVDLTTRKVGLIRNSRPWIDPQRMQPMNIIQFKTRDGHRLDAYLTLPAGATKQNPPPLVVLPHGGPQTRSTWGFDSFVQFFASRGYAVLQPNYRGSPGYDWMFPREDDWAFAKMRDDVNDAAKGLAAAGLIDGRRIAIMGTGFGGYLATAAIASEPALYRCAVSISGVYDWAETIRDNKFYGQTTAEYNSGSFYGVLYRLGDPKKETEKFEALSVLHHAGQIRVPVFLAYGEYDSSVLVSQAKSLESALKRNGDACELQSFRDEASGIRRLKNVIDLSTGIEAFLAKNMAATRAP